MSFEAIVCFTCLTIFIFIFFAFVRHQDPFHPLICIGPMLLFLYVFLPLYLAVTQGGELRSYVSEGDLAYVQLINWLGVVSLCSGTLIGGRSAGRWDEVRAEPEALSPAAHRRLVRTGVVLGAALSRWLMSQFQTELFTFPYITDSAAYGRSALFVAAAVIGAALAVRRSVDRLDMVSVLKSRE